MRERVEAYPDQATPLRSRPELVISTATYPTADIARWREGTFPHSNELNAERRSKGYKSEPGSEVKTDPHQLTPTVPASTLDARRSWDGSMTHPDDAPPQTVNRHSTVTHYQRPNMTHPQEGGTGGEVSEILFFSAKSKRRPSLIYSMQIIPVCLSIVA